MIEALAPDTPQKPLAHRIHQRRAHRRAQDANPGALGNAIEVRAELVVSIADDDLRALAERRRVAKLLRGPLLGRHARDRNVDDTPGVHVDDEECEMDGNRDSLLFKSCARCEFLNDPARTYE